MDRRQGIEKNPWRLKERKEDLEVVADELVVTNFIPEKERLKADEVVDVSDDDVISVEINPHRKVDGVPAGENEDALRKDIDNLEKGTIYYFGHLKAGNYKILGVTSPVRAAKHKRKDYFHRPWKYLDIIVELPNSKYPASISDKPEFYKLAMKNR